MAKYLLEEGIALRSWSDLPYAYCRRGKLRPVALSRKEFLTLLLCDGRENLDFMPLVKEMLEKGLIREVSVWAHYFDESFLLSISVFNC